MKPKSALPVILLLFAGVLAGTIFEPGFHLLRPESALFIVAVLISLGLAVLMLYRQANLPTWLKLGYISVQILFFLLLHLLPVPHNLVWLLAMPVLSHATFFLPWPGVAATIAAYMGVFLWSNHGYLKNPGDVVRLGIQYGAACLFTVIFTRITQGALLAKEEARRLADELGKANALLREGAERDQRHAAMTERNRIARDIHDGLGHYLTTIAVQLEATRTLVRDKPEEADATLAKAQKQAREALEEVRRSVRTLRTAEPAPCLKDAVAGLINESGLDASFEVHGSPRTLPSDKTQALFRTAQEALTNVRKHAGSRQVWVELNFLSASTEIIVTDKGRGPASSHTGFGLTGLRERLEVLGGSLQAGARPEGGFQLKADIPL